MAENKNQSIAGWPSVTGSRTTGLDLRGLNPQLQRNAKVLEAYQKRYASDVSAVKQMGDATARLTKITQDINARNFARQDQLLTARQGNFQRMNEMYGNYFQQFGNVLNESALKFLDEHSNIGVPTLTAIMAGYEHAKASRAQQELAMLDRQAKMAEAAYALDKQRADLETLKEQNAALSQQTALENQIKAIDAINKSQNQYYSDVARVYGAGVAGGRGTGVAGAGGLGSGSAAGSFQAPVTGGAGGAATATSAVADGGATGFVDPSNPQVAALNKMIDDSKAAQIAGQASQLGPLATRARGDIEGITQWSDLDNIWARGVALGGTYFGGKYLTASGNRVNSTLTKTLTDSEKLLTGLKSDRKSLAGNIKLQEGKYLTAQSNALKFENRVLSYAQTKDSARFLQAGNDLDRYIEIVKNSKMSNADKAVVDMYNKSKTLTTEATKIGKQLDDLRGIYDVNKISVVNAENAVTGAKSAIDASKNSVRKIVARGAGKLLSKAALPLTIVDTVFNYGDEVFGAGAAGLQWLGDRISDLAGFTTVDRAKNRPTIGQYYNENRDAYLAAQNQFFNTISGGRLNVALEDADVQQAVGRLRELGWGGEGSDWGENNFNIHQLMQMKRNDPDSFYKALDALYQYDLQINGNISPLEYFNRAASKAAFDRTYVTQANKAAQNQQITNQEIMRDQRIADALAGKHKFFAGMAEFLARNGREAGYDFDEADAAAMMGRLIEMNQAIESGGKFGAVGANTSTGTAKSRHQFMDMTFDQLRKWMLEDDNKAGGIFFDDNERNALRQARTANDLDNEQFGYLLDLMVPYYLMKDNVNIGKFGKGNPNIGSLQALVDLSQMTKDIGISPYLDSSMNALRMAGFGRFKAGKEFDETVSRFNRDWQGPTWSAQFGDRATSNGAYRSRDMYLQDFANNGILLGPYQNKVPANEYLQWVNEYFVVDKDGNITGIKEGANPKHFDKWREENGLTRAQKVGVPQQIVRSNNVRLDKGVNFDNLNRTLRQRVNKFADNLYSQYGFGIDVTSGHRTPEDQARVKRDPNSSMPANPGSSPHQAGLGIDLSIRRLRDAFNKSDAAKQKYNGDFNKFIEEEAKAAGLYRFDPKGDPFHFGMIEDDDYKANVDHDLYMKDKAAGKLSDSKRYEKNQGLTLPSLPALRQVQPFSPAQWTDPVVESVNQGIVDPLDLSAFDGMMPGGVNFSPTNYGAAMEQMGQYNQQLQTPIGWDIDGNPIYQ